MGHSSLQENKHCKHKHCLVFSQLYVEERSTRYKQVCKVHWLRCFSLLCLCWSCLPNVTGALIQHFFPPFSVMTSGVLCLETDLYAYIQMLAGHLFQFLRQTLCLFMSDQGPLTEQCFLVKRQHQIQIIIETSCCKERYIIQVIFLTFLSFTPNSYYVLTQILLKQ